MASNQTWTRAIALNNQLRVLKAMLSIAHRKALNRASCQRILAIICLSLSVFGCESHKLTQCEQIFPIARDNKSEQPKFERPWQRTVINEELA